MTWSPSPATSSRSGSISNPQRNISPSSAGCILRSSKPGKLKVNPSDSVTSNPDRWSDPVITRKNRCMPIVAWAPRPWLPIPSDSLGGFLFLGSRRWLGRISRFRLGPGRIHFLSLRLWRFRFLLLDLLHLRLDRIWFLRIRFRRLGLLYFRLRWRRRRILDRYWKYRAVFGVRHSIDRSLRLDHQRPRRMIGLPAGFEIDHALCLPGLEGHRLEIQILADRRRLVGLGINPARISFEG